MVLNSLQKTDFSSFIRNSLLFENIDIILFFFLVLTIISTSFAQTNIIGILAALFSLACFLKAVVKRGETAELSLINKVLILYLLFVIISLMGASYFILSLKGIIKTFIYIAFYFASVYFLSQNKKKIIPLIFITAGLTVIESIIAVIQNMSHIEAIATWQDTSNVANPIHIISRAYGTLKPYNPNLLAGYLITGISSVFAIFGISCINKNKKMILISLAAFLITIFAVFATGCRGAYLGLFGLAGIAFLTGFLIVKKYFGSFKNIKMKYKIMLSAFVVFISGLIFLVPSFSQRILSIFSLRKDSSISFRMNVYEACYRMFADNKFLGIGVGNKNFREIYGLYMKTGYDALGSYCVPLEIAVESGIFALISFLAFIILIIVKIIKYLNSKNKHPVHKIIVYSVLLTITAVICHGLFDTVFFRPQIQILFWLNIAVFHSIVIKRRKQKISNSVY